MCMHWFSISYPKYAANIIVEKNIAHKFLKFIDNGESYLILHGYHVMKPNSLMFKLKYKKTLLYSTLLLALHEFKKCVYEYKVSLNIVEKILNKDALFTISIFPDEFYVDTFVGDKIFKSINKKLPLIFFNF